jgi:flagellum-specific peptidoglycan hydrolase FlgJ
MAYPQFFEPLAGMPDSDLLGYGDLVYDDGTRQFLNGEPDIASQYEIKSAAPPAMGPPSSGAQQPPPLVGADGQAYQVDMLGEQPGLKPAGGVTGALNSLGNMVSGGIDSGQPSPGLGDMLGSAAQGIGRLGSGAMAAPQAPQAQPGQPPPAPEPLQGADGRMYEPDIFDPQNPLKPAGQSQAAQAATQGPGFQPFERTGALPPDVAARQQSEMAGMNAQSMQALEQSRSEEARIRNEATLKAMGENDARKLAAEQDVKDQQQKLDRLDVERKQLADMEIDRSLSGSIGLGGGILAIFGSALLASTGSDAGQRMIENSIDRHVRQQVNQRDTKLNRLAEQVGSTRQAIAMGKAEIYKALADKGELAVQKVGNDVFEAQSPQVIQAARAAQQKYTQEWEKESLGKVTERVPVAPKPPSPEALQKYGELRRERAGTEGITGRMEQTLGLLWAPGKDGQPGHYTNRDEVLKRGIQGTGNLEQLIPDIIYATGGGMTAEGRQVRGASEAMAFAQLRAVQPTGPISNSDIERAVKMGALDTEEGLLLGLERMRNSNAEQLTHDAAQFGPDVVGEYERRRQQSGGMGAPATPSASRPATPAEMRGQAQRMRGAQTGAAQPGAQPQGAAIPAEPEQRMAQVAEDLMVLGGEKNLPPRALDILIAQAAHESGNGDSQGAAHGNMFGHKATGGRKGFDANTTEGEGSGARRMKQTFVDYPNIASSVADQLSLLERKYPRAWEALLAEDESAYVAALKDGGFFTGNETQYLQAIQRRL